MITDKKIEKIRKDFNGIDQREIFKMLGDTNRYRIFEMLSKTDKLSVGEISKVLSISIPLSSQHLKVLEQGKLLQKEKVGQKVYYKLRQDNKIAKSIIDEII